MGGTLAFLSFDSLSGRFIGSICLGMPPEEASKSRCWTDGTEILVEVHGVPGAVAQVPRGLQGSEEEYYFLGI